MPTNRGRGGRWQSHRRVINGILFRQRTGLPWRDLPPCFGNWKTVHDRHRRWSADGTWERILRAVQADADAEGRIDWSMVSVDSTTCRAHQHAAGASTRAPKIPGRRRSPARHRSDEALGRSRGGLTSKIHLGASGKTGIIDGTEIRVRRPAAGRKDRDRFVSGKNKQNAVKSMIFTDGDGRLLFCSPASPASCADITHARESGLVKFLADGPAVDILADAGYQGLGTQAGGRFVTPPHRKFKKNAPDRYEEMHERQRKAHSSRRIRVEHGIAHLKNWRALARHLGHREHMSETVQAVAGLLSHQQTQT